MFRLTGFFGVDDFSVIECCLDPGEKRCMSAASVYNWGIQSTRIREMAAFAGMLLGLGDRRVRP